MTKTANELPIVLTCFAYRHEYFAEMEGMLATVREHHPTWLVVVGKGPVPGYDLPTLEVESMAERDKWTCPATLDLDGSENDWRKITKMKGWWIAQVWRKFAGLDGVDYNRLVWLDADARLNGPLDIEFDTNSEVVAGPWWYDPENSDHDTICSGLLLFQGAKGGPVEKIIERWSADCLSQIRDLRPPTVPWLDGDQEVLTEVLKGESLDAEYVLLKLEHDKYAAYANKDGTALEGALVDQWQMSRRMKFPECRDRNWPPPEEARRRSALKPDQAR